MIRNLLICLLLLLPFSITTADAASSTKDINHQGWVGKSPKMKQVQWIPITTKCPQCKKMVAQYNDAAQALLNSRYWVKFWREVAVNRNKGKSDPFWPGKGDINNFEAKAVGANLELMELQSKQLELHKANIARLKQQLSYLASAIAECEKTACNITEPDRSKLKIGDNAVPIPAVDIKAILKKYNIDWQGPYSTNCPPCIKYVSHLNALPNWVAKADMQLQNALAELEYAKLIEQSNKVKVSFLTYQHPDKTDHNGLKNKIKKLRAELESYKSYFKKLIQQLKECEKQCKKTDGKDNRTGLYIPGADLTNGTENVGYLPGNTLTGSTPQDIGFLIGTDGTKWCTYTYGGPSIVPVKPTGGGTYVPTGTPIAGPTDSSPSWAQFRDMHTGAGTTAPSTDPTLDSWAQFRDMHLKPTKPSTTTSTPNTPSSTNTPTALVVPVAPATTTQKPPTDHEDPRDTDKPQLPTILTIKAKESVISGGTQTQTAAVGQQMKLFADSTVAQALPNTSGAKKNDADHDQDPLQCTTGKDGQCQILLPTSTFVGKTPNFEASVNVSQQASVNAKVTNVTAIPNNLKPYISDQQIVNGQSYVTLTYPAGMDEPVKLQLATADGVVNVLINFCRDKQPKSAPVSLLLGNQSIATQTINLNEAR